MATVPVLNAYVDDGGDEIVVIEQIEGGIRERRIRAQYTTYHRASAVGRELMRKLKRAEQVDHVVADGADWIRVGWKTEIWRRQARWKLKDEGIETYEGDVDPVRWWLTESNLPIARPRRCYLDIETDSRVPFSRKEDMRVLCWTISNDEGPVARGVLAEDTEDDEARLLMEMWAVLGNYDQVCAWYGGDPEKKDNGFDFYVLATRSRRCGLTVDTRRWLWLDQLVVWRRMNSAESGDEKESLKLEDIAQHQIGEGKEPTPDWVVERFGKKGLGALAWDLWAAGGKFRQLLVDYCAKDTELLRKLEKRKGFLTLFQTLCEVCAVFGNTQGLFPTGQMDGFLLRLGRQENYRFPTKKYFDENKNKIQFEGAFVLAPRTVPSSDGRWTVEDARQWREAHGMSNGILRNVHVCDFASLYPSNIITWNLSEETRVVDEATIERCYNAFKNNEPMPVGICRSPGTGLFTYTDKPGILPLALRVMLERRKKYADEAAQYPPGTPQFLDAMARSTAYKVAANSFYGVVGASTSRYFNKQLAEATTQNGVWLIKRVMSQGEKRNIVSVAGDSVTPERTVVVRDPGDRVQILPFEKLWSFAKDTKVGKGGKVRGYLPNWMALTEVGWKSITQIIQHDVRKPVHTITTKHGQVRVTEDHSLMCEGKETKPLDFVAGQKKFTTVAAPKEEPFGQIDILQYLDNFELRYPYKSRDVVRKFVPSKQQGFIVLDGWGDQESIRIRRFYRQDSKEFRALLTLIVAYTSDGSASLSGVTSVRNILSFCKSDLEHMTNVKCSLEVIFEGGKIFGPHWSDTVYIVRSGTTAMTCFFAALCGYKSVGKRLPSFLYNLSDRNFRLFFSALGNGDGSIDEDGRLDYTSTSQELTAGISYMLSQRGYEQSVKYREEKKAWSIRTRTGPEQAWNYSIRHEVETYEGAVYDLSVQGAHTFVDGMGRVLLHNTDSAFTVGPTRDGFNTFIKWLNDKDLPDAIAKTGVKESFVKLAYEKAFDILVFSAKKKYCGKYNHYKWQTTCTRCKTKKGNPGSVDVRTLKCRDCEYVYTEQPTFIGKPEIKGLEYRRGDTSRIGREMQGKIIDLLVGGLHTNPDVSDDVARPIMDLSYYTKIIEATRERVMTEPFVIEDVRQSKGINKDSLNEYVSKTKADGEEGAQAPHILVARILESRGQSVGKGTRIEYVTVDGDCSPMKVIPAEDFNGECDRYYLWDTLIYPPTQRLLQGAFPDVDWEKWGDIRPKKAKGTSKVSNNQVGFDLHSATKGVVGNSDLAVPTFSSKMLVVTIPENLGVKGIERVQDVLRANPGARTVQLQILLKGGKTKILPCPMRVATGSKLAAEIAGVLDQEETAS